MGIGIHYGVALYEFAPEAAIRIARKAEELGFDSIWCGDHLVLPETLPVRDVARMDFPIRQIESNVSTARRIFRKDAPMPDLFQWFAFLAATTTHLKFGTAIYLLPLRHPFVSAKAIATCDFLTGGRLQIGVGLGWLPDEYEAAGIDFTTRGRRTNECIAVLRELWEKDVAEFEGEFFSFKPLRFEPKPWQKGGPPLLIGGESKAALRRAATLGDGWCARVQTPQSLAANLEKINAMRREAGRADRPFLVQTRLKPSVTMDEIAALRYAGAHHFLVKLRENSEDEIMSEAEVMQAMSEFADRIVKKL